MLHTYSDVDRSIEKMLMSGPVVFGFDTETTIERKEDHGKVSVIQIHTGNVCYIFQVYRIWKNEGMFPSKLAAFLSNPNYIKVGVAADNDGRMIEKSYGVRVAGVIDVQYIARSMRIPDLSMEGLAARFAPLFHKGSKGNVWTNWDNDLDEKHISYASTDALLSLLIYQGIFTGVVPNEDEYVFDNEQEDNLLFNWLSEKERLPAKSISMLSNFIANSYSRWSKMYSLQERVALAQESVTRMVEDKRLKIYGGYLMRYDMNNIPIARSPVCKSGDEALDLISHQFGNRRKKESLINQLYNSCSLLLKYDPVMKKIKAEELVDKLVQEGKLIYNYGYYYLP